MIMDDAHHVCIEHRDKRALHRAGWIILDPVTVVENGYLEIENGVIQGIHKGTPREKSIDHGPGGLMPCLVNAHLHLELSALKDCLPLDQGFAPWVKALLEKREALGEAVLIREARKAAGNLAASGNLYVGDISTLGISRSIIEESRLNGVCFHEFLGAGLPDVSTRKNDSVSLSVAGHAPHTSAPQLLRALKKRSRADGLPFSIHVAESDDESRFIHDPKGAWAEFLLSRGIDWSTWGIGSKTPIQYIADMGLLDRLTLAVHALNATGRDLEILANSGARVCVCPRSNQTLHKRLPDIETMIQKGLDPALGTDSLASCGSLNIFDEMRFVNRKYPNIDPAMIFAMGTINGARALGLERLTGTLSTGKEARFLYRSVTASNKKDLFQRIISNE